MGLNLIPHSGLNLECEIFKYFAGFLGVLLDKQLECEAEKNEIKSDMNGHKKFCTCIFYRDLL